MEKDFENISNLIKISASNPLKKDCVYSKIVLRRIKLKQDAYFQAEKFTNKQVFHENVISCGLYEWCKTNLTGMYKQICLVFNNKTVTYLFTSKGAVKRLENARAEAVVLQEANNRRKSYLINEGDDVPILIDLGIFTKDRKVVNSMYDKFRQINRFAEILDDAFKNCSEQSLTVLDFGCGKSYLTFIIYYYFNKIKKSDVTVIGYDLKSDVVSHCNDLAQKYGYRNLRFETADVSKDKLRDGSVDAVISLHACDTATDYALNYAVKHNAKYIFSVPCCQHEINQSIKKGGDFDVFLRYGIVKERVSALLTDTIRAMLLEDEGYKVDVMEFVDLAHSPKNIMIRAVKTRGKSDKNSKTINGLIEKYGFEQRLTSLLKKDL